MSDNIVQLRSIRLFASLPDHELRKIGATLRIRTFRKNATILHEEDTNEYMYAILDGRVKVVQTTEDGRETIIAMHQTGDFFGEMTLIDGKTMPAAVLALEQTVTAVISRREFAALLASQNKVRENLLVILCGRLRESWNKIQMLNFNNAANRIKVLFALLSVDYGEKNDNGVTLNVKLTHQNIANMAGISRETATRILDKWRKDKEITILKDRHIRLSPDFLQKETRLS